jgi:hypothetical protein
MQRQGQSTKAGQHKRTAQIELAVCQVHSHMQLHHNNNEISITQRWVHQREAQGPTPLENGGEALQEMQHTNCR